MTRPPDLLICNLCDVKLPDVRFDRGTKRFLCDCCWFHLKPTQHGIAPPINRVRKIVESDEDQCQGAA